MYILTPAWLAKHGIIETGSEVGIEADLTQPGFRYQFPKDKATWSVTPHRIVIESQNPETDCGVIIAKILQVLPETPLLVLGSNTHYHSDLSERENLSPSIRDFPDTQPPSKERSLLQRTFHEAVKLSENAIVNLQIAIKEDSINLDCNVHHDLDNCDNRNEVAVAAAERFFRDRDEAKSLAQHFFGASIDHDPNNA